MATALTETDVFTASIVVPDPGDDRKASSVVLPLQGLANRTKNLKGLIEDYEDEAHTWATTQVFEGPVQLKSGGSPIEVEYWEGYRERRFFIPLKPVFVPSGWVCGVDNQAWAHAGAQTLPFWIGRDVVASNCIIRRVRAGLSMNGPVTLDICRMVPGTSPVSAYAENGTPDADSFTPSGTQLHILDVAGLNLEARNYDFLHRIRVKPTSGTTVLYWIELTVDDIGPRNF